MESNYITVNNLKLHFRKAGQSGPSVLFIHGNSSSSLSWQKQLNSNLSAKYQLYALDLPGHGLSDKALSPETTYSPQGFAKLLCDFVQTLKLNHFVLVGHSMGGNIALQALPVLRKYLKGLLLTGSPPLTIPLPMAEAFFPNPILMHAFTPELNADQANQLANEFFNGNVPSFAINDILNTDPASRLNLGASISTALNIADEFIILNNNPVPLCIVHGKHDKLIQLNYIKNLDLQNLFQNKIHELNSSHMVQWDDYESFNTLTENFISTLEEL